MSIARIVTASLGVALGIGINRIILMIASTRLIGRGRRIVRIGRVRSASATIGGALFPEELKTLIQEVEADNDVSDIILADGAKNESGLVFLVVSEFGVTKNSERKR